MSIPDFTLLIGDGWTETVDLRGVLFEATSVWRCCPSDGTMRDITEDKAHEWFGNMSDPWDAVPPMFEPFIESDIHDWKERLENAPDALLRAFERLQE